MGKDLSENQWIETDAVEKTQTFESLLGNRPLGLLGEAPLSFMVVGELLAITDEGRTPLVACPGPSGGAVLRARSVLDLHGGQIGQAVLLAFEAGDSARPIIIGVLRSDQAWPLADAPGQVQIDADGERMLVSARHELVLRCGKASVTLRHDGKVEIRGESILSQATGSNRLQGGSVQLN